MSSQVSDLNQVTRPGHRKLRWFMLFLLAVILAGVAAAGIWIYLPRQLLSKYLPIVPTAQIPGAQPAALAKPDFPVLLPNGVLPPASNARLNYDTTRKVASFSDTIGSAPVTVSEQPLPQNVEKDPATELTKLAATFGTTTRLVSTPTAYLGTSVLGVQTVVLQDKSLLIFIYTTTKVDNTKWIDYIGKLR